METPVRNRGMSDLSDPRPAISLYPYTVTKQPEPNKDQPDPAASQEAKLLWAFDGLIDAEGPLMITSWVAIIEYIDSDGETQLQPLSSDMPQWRMTGMIDAGREMLLDDYEFFTEYDEHDD